MQIETPDSGMTEEQELDALMQALLAETDNQADATPEQLAELDRETGKLAMRLELDALLSEEVTPYDEDQFKLWALEDKLNAGHEPTHEEALEGLKLALEHIEAVKSVSRMFLDELNKQDKENQRLRAALRPAVQFETAGNC